MSDVKITRDHRLRAMLAAYDAGESSLSSEARQWVDGNDSFARGRGLFAQAERAATVIATAEHNLRAAVIADLRGLVERSEYTDLGENAVRVSSIELLIETLEEQQS